MTARPSSDAPLKQDPYFLDTDECPDWKNIFGNFQPLNLEIGFAKLTKKFAESGGIKKMKDQKKTPHKVLDMVVF